MANFSTTIGTQSITQNSEFSIAQGATYSSGSPKTTTGYVQAWIDFTALVAGDSVEVRIYRAINSGTQTAMDVATIKVAQIYSIPLVLVNNAWDVTVKLTTATTRSIKYEVITDTNDVNTATLSSGAITAASIASAAITAAKFATDAIDANALKTDAVTEITDAIFNYVIEASPSNATTFLQRVRILWSIIAGKANGLTIATGSTENFRDAADSKNRASYTVATDGTRIIGSVDGT